MVHATGKSRNGLASGVAESCYSNDVNWSLFQCGSGLPFVSYLHSVLLWGTSSMQWEESMDFVNHKAYILPSEQA